MCSAYKFEISGVYRKTTWTTHTAHQQDDERTHTSTHGVNVSVAVYNYFRGVRCAVSVLIPTNLQPNRISKEENKKEIIQLHPVREKLHTNGKFDDAFRALYLYDIQPFSPLSLYSSKWKKITTKNKRNDYFIWRTSSRSMDVCLLFIFLGRFYFSSVSFSHWFSRGYLFFPSRCRFVRLWLEWRKLSHIHLLIITTDANVTRNVVFDWRVRQEFV